LLSVKINDLLIVIFLSNYQLCFLDIFPVVNSPDYSYCCAADVDVHVLM